MKDSSKSNLKRSALLTGGALAGGAAGAALLGRKKRLRIGTPLSKSKVVGKTPAALRSAAGRAVELAERIDDRLREFAGGQRERDGAGRFEPGNVPSADEFAIAEAAGKGGRKLAAGAGLAVAAGGAAALLARRGKKLPKLGNAPLRLS